MTTEKTEQKEPKSKRVVPTPKPIAFIDEYFADRNQKYNPHNLDETKAWANKQLLKMREDGYPVISSILKFEPKFSEFLVREVLHNQDFDWVGEKYKLFVRADRLLPTNEPTGAPLPSELHQEVIALEIGLKSSFNKQSDRTKDHQVKENQAYSSAAMHGAFATAKRKYKWDGNPILIQEISKYGTEVNLVKAITLLHRYGADVTAEESNQWLFEV